MMRCDPVAFFAIQMTQPDHHISPQRKQGRETHVNRTEESRSA